MIELESERKLEDFMDSIQSRDIEIQELSDYEKGILFFIGHMFPRDIVFREFTMGMVKLFTLSTVKDKRIDLLTDLIELAERKEKQWQ